ncbi:MAG: hypothetical protein QOK28_2235 [Actinomycetota bacterium]
MTDRKPAGASFESWVDAQINEARDRGEFENLPGFGKPLPDLTGDHDELWWIRNWLKRENLSFTPPAIALRKAAEDLLATLDKFPTERGLRAALDELNARVREMNRSFVVDGPPSNMMPLDVEPIVVRWAALRAERAAAVVEEVVAEPVAAPKRRWFRRTRQ